MGIKEAIRNHSQIMCDTAPIICFIEEHKIFGAIADSFFSTIRDSAELRSKYSIKTPDAIQLAIGIENNATLFITNDKDLKKINEISVLVLENYLSQNP